jgi:O-antigen ligase
LLRSLVVIELIWFVGASYHVYRYGIQDLVLRNRIEQGYLEKVVGVDNLAVSVLMFLPLVYFFLSLEQTSVWRFLAWLSFVLSLATTVITFSRNGFVNMMAVLFLIFFRQVRSPKILVFFLILIMIVLLAPSSYWSRISTISSLKVESGLSHKISLVQSGFDIIVRNPVFGIGLGKLTRAVHNTALQIAVEVGLPALFAFLGLLYFAFRELITARLLMKKRDGEEWPILPQMLSISLIAYLIGGLSISIPRYLPFIILLGLIVAMKNLDSSDVLACTARGE